VDWIYLQSGLFIIVVTARRGPEMERLDLRLNLAQRIKENLDGNKLGLMKLEEKSPLRELDGLVRLLAQLIKPGNYLLYSPNSLVHPIPLHTTI
jgi:hypothetical protein